MYRRVIIEAVTKLHCSISFESLYQAYFSLEVIQINNLIFINRQIRDFFSLYNFNLTLRKLCSAQNVQNDFAVKESYFRQI